MARTKNFDQEIVLEKILDLFCEKGYHQSSLDEILHVSGIGRQSLYNTYGDKKTLYLKAVELYRTQTIDRLRKVMQKGIENGWSYHDILLQLLDLVNTSNCSRKGCILINSMVEFKSRDCDVDEFVNGMLLEWKNIIKKIIEQGQEKKEFIADMPSEHIADIIINVRSGIQIGKHYGKSQDYLLQVAENTIALITAR